MFLIAPPWLAVRVVKPLMMTWLIYELGVKSFGSRSRPRPVILLTTLCLSGRGVESV
jgi:hypothetical protein